MLRRDSEIPDQESRTIYVSQSRFFTGPFTFPLYRYYKLWSQYEFL